MNFNGKTRDTNDKITCVCETLCPRWQRLKKAILVQRSKSRSQGHWPWFHLIGHH